MLYSIEILGFKKEFLVNARCMVILGVLVLAGGVIRAEAEIVEKQQTIDVEIKGRNNRGNAKVDQKTQDILARFAAIFMSFLGILQNPDDPTDHVVNMVTGAVHMVAEAVRKGELSLDATDEEINAYALHITRNVEPTLKRILL